MSCRSLRWSTLLALAPSLLLAQTTGTVRGRVTSAGYGESRPIVENKTAAGREKNRRVEFVIVDVGDAAGDATDVRGTKGVSEQPVRAPDSPTVGGK